MLEWILVPAGYVLWLVLCLFCALGLREVMETPWAEWVWPPSRVLLFLFSCLLGWTGFFSFGAANCQAERLLGW